MSVIPARYYDGKTSAPHQVAIEITPDHTLCLYSGNQRTSLALDQVKIAPRLGSVPRRISLPDGAILTIADNDALDAQLRRYGRPAGTWLHRLESHWYWVCLALLGVLGLSWLFVTFGFPALARKVAYALPGSVHEAIGTEGLRLLDRVLLRPSTLSPQRQAELQAIFTQVAQEAGNGQRLRLVLRTGNRIGANALALPAGIVILTDELVAVAQHDEELLAVLAHEVGHVAHRHALRRLLQNSWVAMLVMALTGDVSTASALATTIPTLLVQTRYSRQFEREADEYAYAYLARHGISGQRLGALLTRLAALSDQPSGLLQYFATHPATKERVRD